jgi:hypothetical protein
MKKKEDKLLKPLFVNLYNDAENGQLTQQKLEILINRTRIDINKPIQLGIKKNNDPPLTLLAVVILFAEKYKTEVINGIVRFLLAQGANSNVNSFEMTSDPSRNYNRKDLTYTNVFFFIMSRLEILTYSDLLEVILSYT